MQRFYRGSTKLIESASFSLKYYKEMYELIVRFEPMTSVEKSRSQYMLSV